MFTTMFKKRPTFDFWKYEGTEVLPGKVAERLHNCGYSFTITTHQLNTDDTATRVNRVLNLFRNFHGDTPAYTVSENEYLMFKPEGTVEVLHESRLSDYETG